MLRKDFEEILGSEIISLTGGLVAGFLLTFAVDKLYLIPSLFILFPGFMEMRGNISGTLSARLSAGLHVGAFRPVHRKKDIVRGNVLASVVLVVLLSLFLGMLAYYVSMEFFGVANPNIILIALLAGILSNVIEIPITIISTFWIFKHGHDPDNIMGPYVTTMGDIVSILSLLIAVYVV